MNKGKIILLLGICLLSFPFISFANENFSPTNDIINQQDNKSVVWVQYNLGLLYYYGDGVSRDYSKAALLWQKASDQGLADAQFNLGLMHDDGKEMSKDKRKSIKYYKKTCLKSK